MPDQSRRSFGAPFACREQREQIGVDAEPLPVAAARGCDEIGDGRARVADVTLRQQRLRDRGERVQDEVVAPATAPRDQLARAAQRRVRVGEREMRVGQSAERGRRDRVEAAVLGEREQRFERVTHLGAAAFGLQDADLREQPLAAQARRPLGALETRHLVEHQRRLRERQCRAACRAAQCEVESARVGRVTVALRCLQGEVAHQRARHFPVQPAVLEPKARCRR